MRNIKDHKTDYLFDPWRYLGPKRRKLLEESWAGLFRRYLFHKLPVEKIAGHFHETMGRPSKEIFVMLGTTILQQMHDLSDEETQGQLAFDTRWRFALDISDESDTESYACPRTLWKFRQIVMEEDLDKILFETLTDELIDVFDVDTSKQRIDSTHIRSNMKKLGRVGIFANTIKKFLINLKRQHREMFDRLLPGELSSRYLDKEAFGCFSRVKPSKAKQTLKGLSEDLLTLIELFKEYPEVRRLNSYQLMERVLLEQCEVKGEAEEKKVEVKAPKKIPSNSLQNPSDPDCTYDGHKGQGYQVQLMETYTPVAEDARKDETKPHLITYVEVEPAHKSDANALLPALENTKNRGCAPEEVTADSLYGSDENVEDAAEMEVKVISPTMSSDAKEGKLGLKDFEIDRETGRITRCPQGIAPVKTKIKANGTFVANFNVFTCRICPDRDRCPVRLGKRKARISYTSKQVRLAFRRKNEETSGFIDQYRWRAGIEATASHYKSETGANRIRVRRLPNVSFAAILKTLGLNIRRAARAYAARFASLSPFSALYRAILTANFSRRALQSIIPGISLSKSKQIYRFAA